MARTRNGEWTYRWLDHRLGTRDHVTLMNNTHAYRHEDGGDAISVVLHSTVVATLWPDGTVQLNSGGWRTPTTKHRLNAVLPAGLLTGWSVVQEDFEWYVIEYQPNPYKVINRYPFVDGMKVRTR